MKMLEATNALNRYKTHRLSPGSFLSSILENDLLAAVRNADQESKERLIEIVEYCWKDLPANIWGSKTAVEKHLNGKENCKQPQEFKNIDIDFNSTSINID